MRVRFTCTVPSADSQLYSNFLHIRETPSLSFPQDQVTKSCQTVKRHPATAPPPQRGTRDPKSRNPPASNGKTNARATTITRTALPHETQIVSTAATATAPLVHATTTATPNARAPIPPAPPTPAQTSVPAPTTPTHSIVPATPHATDPATTPRNPRRKRNPPPLNPPPLPPRALDP